jgi:hypothetical protein
MIAMAVTASTCSILAPDIVRPGLLPDASQLVGVHRPVRINFRRPLRDILPHWIVLGCIIDRESNRLDRGEDFILAGAAGDIPLSASPPRLAVSGPPMMATERITIDPSQHVHGVDHRLAGHVGERPLLEPAGRTGIGIVRSPVTVRHIG